MYPKAAPHPSPLPVGATPSSYGGKHLSRGEKIQLHRSDARPEEDRSSWLRGQKVVCRRDGLLVHLPDSRISHPSSKTPVGSLGHLEVTRPPASFAFGGDEPLGHHVLPTNAAPQPAQALGRSLVPKGSTTPNAPRSPRQTTHHRSDPNAGFIFYSSFSI